MKREDKVKDKKIRKKENRKTENKGEKQGGKFKTRRENEKNEHKIFGSL